ncbi:MAG: creatininase family protein, partial [Pseudomonadota bacterium]
MIIEQMTSPEFTAGLKKTTTAILPLGSVEEHGLHLPLSTDTMHIEALARAAAEEVDVFVAPAIPYGLCRSTSDHPGTVSISFDTVRALVKDVGQSLYRQGLRRLILATGHAGFSHQAAMIEAGEDLSRTCPELIVAVVSVVDLLVHQVAQKLSRITRAFISISLTGLPLMSGRTMSGKTPAIFPPSPEQDIRSR